MNKSDERRWAQILIDNICAGRISLDSESRKWSVSEEEKQRLREARMWEAFLACAAEVGDELLDRKKAYMTWSSVAKEIARRMFERLRCCRVARGRLVAR